MPLFFIAFLAIALSFCSSGPLPQKTFSSKEEKKNPYFQYFLRQSPDFQQKLAKSAFNLFRAGNDVSLNSADRLAREEGGVLQAFPPIRIHGDFHPQQMCFVDGAPALEDFDTIDFGPFWLDLFRMETGAQVMAMEENLRLYKGGACVEEYFEVLRNAQTKNEYSNAGRPLSELRSSDYGVTDPRQLEVWTKRSSSLVTDEVKIAYTQKLAAISPGLKLVEMRSLNVGIGSFNTEKYLVLLSDNSMRELKRADKEPLKPLTSNTKGGQMNPCQRIREGSPLYVKETAFTDCLQVGERHFTERLWRVRYGEPKLEAINNETDLQLHLKWMCHELARAHASQWSAGDLNTLLFTFKKNPLPVECLLFRAKEEGEAIFQAHRMALEFEMTPKE